MSTGPPTNTIPPPQPTDASPTGGPPPTPSGDPGNNNSASLYLYTFLATLVLLLVVSAAIVVRSFILRRRHRMMIEDAIRNGTLFPPLATSYGLRTRVDLSKKPKIWDAWIEKQERPASGRSREKEWYWDMMKPLSAVYVLPPSGNSDDYSSSNRQGTMSPRQSLRVRVGSAARHAGRTLAHYVSTRPSINTPHAHASSQSSSAQLASPTVLTDLSSGYATVKVAVLIAMPRKSATKGSTPPPFSPSSSSLQPLHSLFPSHDEEEELPHLEMGVTEVRVVPSPDDNVPEDKSNMGTV